MTTITLPRAVVEQALEALEDHAKQYPHMQKGYTVDAITALRAALTQQAEPTGKKSLQVESVVAENATTQQQIEQTPPSDYRRGYWAGFAIGKREGRIEAEDELAQQAEPVPTHRINSWGFCGVCRHDRIPGEGCARQECPDSPQQAESVEPVAWMHNILEDNIIRHRPADLKRSPQNWTPLYNCAQPRQTDPQIEDRLARHGIPKP